MPTTATARIFDAFRDGRSALLVDGRSLFDLCVDDADGRLRTIRDVLRRRCLSEFGMVLITYSMAGGIEWHQDELGNRADRDQVSGILRSHGLLDIPLDSNEVVRVLRGVASLARASTEGLRWADGRQVCFGFLIEFGEHLAPGALTNGSQSDAQLLASELAHLTAQSQALRNSGNLVIFSAREGMMDDLVAHALFHVNLPQPDAAEKSNFVETSLALYARATLETGLTPEKVAHLTTNSPNRGIESLVRASHRTGRPVRATELAEDRARAVAAQSEGTLRVLDTERVRGVDLRGRNVMVPLEVLRRYARGLAVGDRTVPNAVALVGGPGVGKTDLGMVAAREAGVSVFEVMSPKNGIVGGTERNIHLQQRLRREWIPNIGFHDEITETLPLERSDFDGDSGASRAVQASLLTHLSDESQRGRTLDIGTTNRPWAMGEAARSRFRFLAVLGPLFTDLCEIVEVTARRVDSSTVVRATDEEVQAAAKLFLEKGASPRHIRAAMSEICNRRGRLGAAEVLEAAGECTMVTDRISVIHAELWAIRVTSFRSDLPWAADPQSYPFPEHLRDLVNPVTGDVDQDALEKRIKELKPYAKV